MFAWQLAQAIRQPEQATWRNPTSGHGPVFRASLVRTALCARRKDTERQAVLRYSGKSHEKQSNSKQAGGKGSMAKARSTTTGASVRARAAAKPRSARSHGTPSIQVCREATQTASSCLVFLATMFALLALAGTAARALPADLQELPFVPIVVSATPWFTLLGLIALLLAIVSRRILAALIAIAAIACNGYWQYPFFYSTDPLPKPRRTPWPQPPPTPAMPTRAS